LNQFQIVAEDLLESEDEGAVVVPSIYPEFKYLFKIHSLCKGEFSLNKIIQRITRLDIPLNLDEITANLGKIYSSNEAGAPVHEIALV